MFALVIATLTVLAVGFAYRNKFLTMKKIRREMEIDENE